MQAPGRHEFFEAWITAVFPVSKMMPGVELALNKYLLEKKKNEDLDNISLKYHFWTTFSLPLTLVKINSGYIV